MLLMMIGSGVAYALSKAFFPALSQAAASSNLGVIQAPLPPWQQTG